LSYLHLSSGNLYGSGLLLYGEALGGVQEGEMSEIGALIVRSSRFERISGVTFGSRVPLISPHGQNLP
jgi:hypothetical protein